MLDSYTRVMHSISLALREDGKEVKMPCLQYDLEHVLFL